MTSPDTKDDKTEKERTDLQADRVDHYLFSETVQSHMIQISRKLIIF